MVLLLVTGLVWPAAAQAQTLQSGNLAAVKPQASLEVPEQHFRRGQECLERGDVDCARREFDRAIDYVLDLGVDVRGDEPLQRGLRDLIERISRYELGPAENQTAAILKTQEFIGQPESDRPEITDVEARYDLTGPLTPAEFQKRFAQLRQSFRTKYNRDIVLTGADHGEHRRLYGKGSAFDIRARDLNREQVGYILSEGNKLGLRIKDFSTWEKVEAHNRRSYLLGRPLDTYATAPHLHIDRMMPARKGMVATPVIKTKKKESAAAKNQ